MTALVWDSTDNQDYENGIDRGVLYPSEGFGVAWNGLISVQHSVSGAEQSFFALDGVSYLNNVGSRNYLATVAAYSAPREFGPCVGDLEVRDGFILTRQPRSLFDFSYRTGVGDSAYKLHLVYNVLATPTSRSSSTTNDTPDPENLEWTFDATPPSINSYQPTAHLIVDSRSADPVALAALEDILYGVAETNPDLPLPDQLLEIFQ